MNYPFFTLTTVLIGFPNRCLMPVSISIRTKLKPHSLPSKIPLARGLCLLMKWVWVKPLKRVWCFANIGPKESKLLIICPAALRRQWASELLEKFNLPAQVLDAKTFAQQQKEGIYNPLNNKQIVIMSYHYAAKLEDKLVAEMWDLVVIDEAHKLRNAHRDSNKMGQALKRALDGRKKLLLTATCRYKTP